MQPAELDLDFVRAHFPAFSEPGLRHWAHFDNAGATYASRYVIWRLARFYKERKVPPYGPSGPSKVGGAEMDDARISLAQSLGVQADELSFGASSAQNAYVLAHAFGDWLSPEDAVIVTDQDREEVSVPLRRLARHGVQIREWQIRPDGLLHPADLTALLDRRVRLVCFPHCSSVGGAINDAAGIVRRVRAAGALSWIDGSDYAPHGLPSMPAIGADVYSFEAHKSYGPHQGLFYMRKSLASLLPSQSGAVPENARFVLGPPDEPQMAACAGMADYINALYAHHFTAGRDAKGRSAEVAKLMRAHEIKLMAPILDWLGAHPEIRLLGPAHGPSRSPTLTLALPGSAQRTAQDLAKRGIMAGAGRFQSERALAALGIPADEDVLRLSLVHYTSPEEVDRLLAALDHTL